MHMSFSAPCMQIMILLLVGQSFWELKLSMGILDKIVIGSCAVENLIVILYTRWYYIVPDMLFYHVGDTIMSYHMLRIVFTWRHHFLKSKIKEPPKFLSSSGVREGISFRWETNAIWISVMAVRDTTTIAFIGKHILLLWPS